MFSTKKADFCAVSRPLLPITYILEVNTYNRFATDAWRALALVVIDVKADLHATNGAYVIHCHSHIECNSNVN